MMLFSSRGLPESIRTVPGFGVHTFKMVGSDGSFRYCKFHFRPEAAYRALKSPKEAAEIAGQNPDFHHKDLWEAIRRGEYPVWKLCVQVMEAERAETFGQALFDITRVWPHGEFPLIELGKMTLNRNVSDTKPIPFLRIFTNIERGYSQPTGLLTLNKLPSHPQIWFRALP
jgi:catalase